MLISLFELHGKNIPGIRKAW